MMANDNIRIHRKINGDVEHQFGASRMLPAISNDIRLAESFGAGIPIRYYAPKSRAAEDFAQLGILIDKLCV
jgi:chromosome partitioning protein